MACKKDVQIVIKGVVGDVILIVDPVPCPTLYFVFF